jgi:molecular chaperone GrpE
MTQDTSDILTNANPLNTEEVSIKPEEASTPPGAQWWDDSELEKLKAEMAQIREQLARSQADYNNLVRRSREELSQIGEWSENKTILKFLTILDNLERALEHTPEEFKSHAWTEGLTSIVRAMQKTITDFGISRMNSVGQEVNPDLHEVISQVPNADTTIQTEVEVGYIRGDKALRHAKVIVWDGTKN